MQVGRSTALQCALPASLQVRRLYIVLLLCLAAALQSGFARADVEVLPVLQVEETDQDWPVLPARATHSRAVVLDAERVERLTVGDQFAMVLSDLAQAPIFRIDDVTAHVNGDTSFHALSGDATHALTLTVGSEALYGHIELDADVWQLTARKNAGRFHGWLFRSAGLPHASGERDYVIPDHNRNRPPGLQRRSEPLSLNGSSDAVTRVQTGEASVDAAIELDQHFSRSHVLIDETVEAELTLSIRNRSSVSRSLPAIEIYFLLEDAQLLEKPAVCSQVGTANRPYLRCGLSSALDGGETRTLDFRLQLGPEAETGRLWSSAFVGDLRHDAFVAVVPDVLRDSENRGLSDFNAALLPTTTLDPRGDVIIDVMALYTDETQALYDGQAETRINQLIGVANRIYRDSGVRIHLRPVHHRQVSYDDTEDFHRTLDRLTYGEHPAFTDIPPLRESYGADLVILFQPLTRAADSCGLANLGGYRSAGYFGPLAGDEDFQERDFAYSVVALDCPISSVVAHEVGHNMGLTHSHAENEGGGTFHYATGHGVHNQFTTVMADPAYFGDAERVARFSNPDLLCFGNQSCGVDHRDTLGADAVRTLNTVRFQIANYYDTRVPPLPGRAVATGDGAATDARIAMAASIDGGRSFVQRIAPDDVVDVQATFYIDDRHMGHSAALYLLADIDGHYLQINANGEVTDGWDGRIESLVPHTESLNLGAIESVTVLRQVVPGPGTAGQRISIYIAYESLETGEFVFTAEPLVLDVTDPQAGVAADME